MTVHFSIFIFLITIFLFGANSQSYSDFVVDSLENNFPAEIEYAETEDKRLVVMFSQQGCPYCDKMRTRILPNERVNDFFSKHFIMIESNIKGNLSVVSPNGKEMKEAEMAKSYRVRATPVFIFFDSKGEEALRLTGFLNSELFLKAGNFVVQGMHHKNISFFSYLKSNTQ